MKRKSEIHRPNSPEWTHYVPNAAMEVSLYPKLLYAGVLECSRKWKEMSHSHPFLEVILIRRPGTYLTLQGDKSSTINMMFIKANWVWTRSPLTSSRGRV
jgi:hypothetical protein